jgi:glycine betaine/proline transport system permease protein
MTVTDLTLTPATSRIAHSGWLLSLLTFALVGVFLLLRAYWPWLTAYPAAWVIPVATWINHVSDWVATMLQPISRPFAWMLGGPMSWLRTLLVWLPWPAVTLAVTLTAYKASGWRLAAFAIAVSAYLLLTGYWPATMNTMALVILAVPISVVAGFGLGVVAFAFPRARLVIEAALDLMQTVPAFAYLIPLLILFGFGPVVGLIASIVFAVPPMVRNTLLGLSQVPAVIKEAGLMSGCTAWQGFWHTEVPAAKPQLLMGVNQTTMAAFSMVIIASLAGGSADIGWEVLSAVRQADFGRSLLSGLVIAMVAVLIDRITLGFARAGETVEAGRLSGRWLSLSLIAILLGGIGLRLIAGAAPWLAGSTQYLNMEAVDAAVLGLVRDHAGLIETIRNGLISFVMLPVRVGLEKAVTPFTWGMTLTWTGSVCYGVAILAAALLLAGKWGRQAGLAALWTGLFIYFGITTFPWPAMVLVIGLFAWRMANARMAFFALAAMAFALLSGLWQPMMQSLYLCALAVLLCLLIGGALGLWAAHNDRVSAVLRPINDALQTMPQFVFLIPALMFFKVGELTALIAVMLYAIVPPIRYVEHGLRHVPGQVVEAAVQSGCTPTQLLWLVKLPLALPTIMLGVNQTIMSALSMLAIAALVGTRDLGQQVYIALGKADAGRGLIAGLMIALIAMVSDRIIRAWCLKRQAPATA